MKNLLAGLCVLVLACSEVGAQPVTIEHQPVGCAAAEKFPRLQARFTPAETVATARVVFQGQTADWYSVTMKPEGTVFVGVLPKPQKSLKTFRYYIEVTDKALGSNRTADYTASVIDSSGACQGKTIAEALGTASVVLQVPAGAAALPAGFASTGVAVAGSAAGTGSVAGGTGAAGGGGLSGTTLAVVGGVAAGGALVATQVGGGEATYAGPFQIGTVLTRLGSGNTSQVICSAPVDIVGTLRIEDRGGGNGHLFADWTERSSGGGNCALSQADRVDNDISLDTPGNIQYTRSFSVPVQTGSVTRVLSFSGALRGDTILGTWTMSWGARTTPAANGAFITDAYPPTGASVTLKKD